jgi:phosphotransferase system enzyme I (PtsI)
VIIKPTERQLKYYHSKIKIIEKLNKELCQLRDKPAVTLDGKEIILRGNIDVPEELEFLKMNGGKGVGLLRTEQVFDISGVFPPEEEQLKFYRLIAENCAPEYVVIRAFDIGGDKVLPHDIKEANPFLGWRGIRFLLDNEEIFKVQIRAVLRAACGNNIKFMIPMVSSILEITRTKDLIEKCKEELKKDEYPYGDVKLGIMVEVPSAFIMAREFAREVDFLSIGTNDLIQYIMAVDRGNENVSSLYQEFNPALVRALAAIIRRGKEEDAFVSVCGEMAADSFAIPLLVGLGLDSVSVSPATIPYLKRIIINITYASAKELADECLKFSSEAEIMNKIKEYFHRYLGDITEI